MAFPTYSEAQATVRHLAVYDLHRKVLAARPDLAEQVTFLEASSLVRADVPGGAVGAGIGRKDNGIYWMVHSLGLHHHVSYWPVRTSPETLAPVFLAYVDSRSQGTPPPSPWCWDETTRTRAVDLADRLTRLGMTVTAVVAENRLYEKYKPRRETFVLTQAPAALGDALAVEADTLTATVAYREALGWVMDIEDDDRTRRWHLGPEFARDPLSDNPVPQADVHALAERVKSMLTGGYGRFADAVQPSLDQTFDSPDPLVTAAAWWLREVGVLDARDDDFPEPRVDCPGIAVTLHRQSRPFGLPALQRAVGVAAVRRERAAVFSTHGFTRDASRFADEAKVPLFTIATDSGRAWGASDLASALLPQAL